MYLPAKLSVWLVMSAKGSYTQKNTIMMRQLLHSYGLAIFTQKQQDLAELHKAEFFVL